MKKLVFGFATLVAVSAVSFAGTETYSGPAAGTEYKQVEQPSAFSDKEWQVDLSGAYEVGHGPNHAGPIHDHGWGGDAAVNYFFNRYFGLSAEGTWIEGRKNIDDRFHGAGGGFNHDKTTFQTATGSLVFRYPIDKYAIAPYVFTGGGATLEGSDWAVFHVGLGLEYRVVPNKFGLFTDGRWNYYGDRSHHDTQNNFLVRVGTRLVF